ncbi:hypothetical protein [Brevundimonas sp.]|uniref:hypothetical protein n=1 Tax=Brevundimonas sp. TaxID=1871086 RepID=UPI0035B4A9C8
MRLLRALSILALMTASPVLAQEVMLRSDLPLWIPESEGVEPYFFADNQALGCEASFYSGRYSAQEPGSDNNGEWIDLSNDRAFSCAFSFSDSRGQSNVAWVINLASVDTDQGAVDLLALQIGALGGSEYRLFMRPALGGLERSLTALDPKCPRRMERRLRQTRWRTDYCAVPNQAALRRIARDAAKRSPAGVFIFGSDSADTNDAE